MGAAVLPERRRRRLPGLPGREVRRPVDHDRSGAHGLRSGAHSPEDWVGRRVGGVELAVCDEAPTGVESVVRGEAPGVLTLDDLIAGVWEELSVCEVVRCPACGGQMTSCGGGTASGADTGGMASRADTGGAASSADAPDRAPHGDCVDCGTQLY